MNPTPPPMKYKSHLLTEQVQTRIFRETLHQACDLCLQHPDKYQSLGHFIRCAIIRLIRSHQTKKQREGPNK